MKKLLILTLLFSGLAANACDICGCSISNYNPNLFPQLSKRYIGAGYSSRVFTRHTGEAGESIDNIRAFTLSAGYKIGKKVHVNANIPLVSRTSTYTTFENKESGMGDLTLSADYRVWEKVTKSFRQDLSLGGGIKLPVGSSDASDPEAEDDALRISSGSVDYLASAHYLVAFRKWAVNTSMTYKYNTQNKQDFRFGDQWTTHAKLLYRKDMEHFSIAPNLVIENEIEWKDAARHALVEGSDSRILSGGPGLDLNNTKIAIGLNYILPLTKENGGVIGHRPAFNAYLSFIF